MATEQKLFDDSPIHPGKILSAMLAERGWTQDELAQRIGYSRQTINELLSGKNGLSNPELAIALSEAFGNTALEWMKWDAAHRLSLVQRRKAIDDSAPSVFDIAPVRDMQRRGWIKITKNADEIASELQSFFGVESLTQPIQFPVAFRRSSHGPNLNPAEKAWCFQARRLASAMPVAAFDAAKLDILEKKVRQLAAYPKEGSRLARLLSEYGIRFVVIEPLPNSTIDGAAFWLAEDSPVIAVTARLDRIDNFWFTVFHEFVHIKNRDAFSIDSDLLGDQTPLLIQDETERRTNDEAASILVPRTELESFIQRVAPLYSKERIIQFAHRIKMHPGIIVGQLQRRKEIGYNANREMLSKIRSIVVETAITDGWGRALTPGIV